jgi:hypothetical protein
MCLGPLLGYRCNILTQPRVALRAYMIQYIHLPLPSS